MNVLSRLNSWLGSLQLAWADQTVPTGNLPTSRPTSRGYMEFHVIKTTAIPKDLILHKFPLEILIEILDQVGVTDLPAFASSCKVLRALAEPLLPTRAAKDPILGRHALVWAADTGNYRLLETMLKLEVDPNAAWYSLESWAYYPPCNLGRAITAQGGGRRAMGRRRHEDLEAEMANEIASRGLSLCTRHRMRTDLVQYGSLVIKPESAVEWRFSALYLAVSRGDEAAVRLLLQSGADLNQPCCEPCHPDFPHEGCWRKWWPQNTCNVWNTLQISVAQGYGSITRLLREHLAVSGEPSTAGGPGTHMEAHLAKVGLYYRCYAYLWDYGYR